MPAYLTRKKRRSVRETLRSGVGVIWGGRGEGAGLSELYAGFCILSEPIMDWNASIGKYTAVPVL